MLLNKLRKLLDSREISARELAISYLDRINTINGGGPNAYIHVNADGIAAAADAAQAIIDAGEQGPLTGLPIALGDDICTIDMPTTCASRMLGGYRPPYDATVAERLRAQGAVFLGKLNIDEFSMGTAGGAGAAGGAGGESGAAGGAAGGAAAAVAADLCAAAVCVDAGGAVSRLAAFSGITGFRPTYGYVSRHGCVAGTSAYDQAGPIAADAEDCALMLDAISGYCPFDVMTYEYKAGRGPGMGGGDSFKGLRLGLIRELLGDSADTGNGIDPLVRESVYNAANWFAKAGASVFEVSIPMLRHGGAAYYIIACAEASANLARYDGVRYGHRAGADAGAGAGTGVGAGLNYFDMVAKSRGEGFGWEAKKRILFGTHVLSGEFYDKHYRKAVAIANAIRARYNEVLQNADALLSPAAPHAAPCATPNAEFGAACGAGSIAEDMWSVGPSIAGLPSVTTPCGRIAPTDAQGRQHAGHVAPTGDHAGLPIGLAITGKRREDMFVLGLAAAYESEFKR